MSPSIETQLDMLARSIDSGATPLREDAAVLRQAAHVLHARETALRNIPSARFDHFLSAVVTGYLSTKTTWILSEKDIRSMTTSCYVIAKALLELEI